MLRQYQAGCFKRKRKGQSTVEYIILVAGVIAVLLIFLRPNGPFHTAFNETLKTGTNGMETIAERLKNSHS
ncbi:MAG TPA: class III signal peptide-containing protein [Candidatus Omnitrophota bacterium]|nr:class III signal peptide-containing protein [Candidatus Omnitrophota bacterium]